MYANFESQKSVAGWEYVINLTFFRVFQSLNGSKKKMCTIEFYEIEIYRYEKFKSFSTVNFYWLMSNAFYWVSKILLTNK